jgi:hypothetical protein
MHTPRKTVRWQPLGHGIRVNESTKHALGWRAKDTLKTDGIGHGVNSSQ